MASYLISLDCKDPIPSLAELLIMGSVTMRYASDATNAVSFPLKGELTP